MTEQLRRKETEFLEDLKDGVRPEHELYQELSVPEDIASTNQHYELPAEFFLKLTGGQWNVYSANLWFEGADTSNQDHVTKMQEDKLDILARHMQLKPGMRIMDVGCGWAGPLGYLAKTYGVRGVGLTLSRPQKAYAEQRIKDLGVDVEIVLSHWNDYQDDEGFDAIYTDEVIVHFNDLVGFFRKVHSLLKPNGLMVNKEVHYTRKDYLNSLTRGEAFINKIFGLTGNYRTMWEELQFVDEAGFELVWHEQLDIMHYAKTMDGWLSNLHANRARLVELVGEETYKNFRIYCKLARIGFNSSVPTLDVITSRKVVAETKFTNAD